MPKFKIALTFLIVCVSISLCISTVHTSVTSSRTLTVPFDYPTIQSAINNASAGDTVFVEKGIYRENIIIDKPLTLTGENNQDTIIEGVPKRFENNPAIAVKANDVTISGFTISYGYNGVSVENFSGCRVVSNIISYNLERGVQLSGEDALVSGNNFLGNTFCGVHVYFSKNSQISSNTIGGSYFSEVGVIVDSSVNITITKNTISSNGLSNEPDSHRGGIRLGRSVSCNVFGNVISDNHGYGVMFAEDVNSTQVHDNSVARNNVGVELFNFLIFGEDQIGIKNQVWNNNFVDNIQQAVVRSGLSGVLPKTPYTNGTDIVLWDNDQKGNYWNNYPAVYPNASEIGNTGVGNTPYMIDQNNADNHPLIQAVNEQSANSQLNLFYGIIIVIVAIVFAIAFLVYFIKRKPRVTKQQLGLNLLMDCLLLQLIG